MSTTVVQPESVSGHGPSGKTIGMVVAGLIVATAVGFGIANQSAPEVDVAGATGIDVADTKYLEAGRTRAAEQQLLLKEATSGVSQSTASAVTETPEAVSVPLRELHPNAPLPERMDYLNAQALTRAEAMSGTAPFTERGDIVVATGTALVTEPEVVWPGVFGFTIPELARDIEHAENVARIQALNDMFDARREVAQDKQEAQWLAKAEFLESQYYTQNGPALNPGDSGIR